MRVATTILRGKLAYPNHAQPIASGMPPPESQANAALAALVQPAAFPFRPNASFNFPFARCSTFFFVEDRFFPPRFS